MFDDTSPGGNPALLAFGYNGPSFNTGGALVDAPTAIDQAFAHLLSVCPQIADVWDIYDPRA